ncbi:MAG TPA: hypothetical protein VHE35_13685 [Kofleriaceae bacterium]|nr:hypothetical protein [Kofleriaceae bacterium]
MPRRLSLVAGAAVLGTVACGKGADGPPRTRGPISSIVELGPDAVRLHAVHHLLELADLHADRWTGGLPASGTIELGANVRIPLDGLHPDLERAQGRLAVRCVEHCQLGDDASRLRSAGGGSFAADGVAFSHLSLDGLEAHVELGDGHARLTDWKFASPDLELRVALDVSLGRGAADSRVDGCIAYRPTEALRARDPQLFALLVLAGGAPGDDGLHDLRLEGSAADPRILAEPCETPSP